MELDVDDVTQRAKPGSLPGTSEINRALHLAYERALSNREGRVADYIPALASADPDALEIVIADVSGGIFRQGTTSTQFTIQSISKAFVYALVCDRLGHQKALELVGVNNTGLPFNSVMALELNGGHPMNPMVNAGALATVGLVPGDEGEARWRFIVEGLSAFAGRDLKVDSEVYTSEMETNQRNLAIARLLESYGRLHADPAPIVDVYTRQCSLLVDATDLAIMGSTLADGGVNPVTKQRVVSADVARDTLAVMASAGLYENSGTWLFEIGLPGKSGVAGGLVTVAPGKAGIGCYGPALDESGNSVRGQVATAYLSRALGLNIFASTPHQTRTNQDGTSP